MTEYKPFTFETASGPMLSPILAKTASDPSRNLGVTEIARIGNTIGLTAAARIIGA